MAVCWAGGSDKAAFWLFMRVHNPVNQPYVEISHRRASDRFEKQKGGTFQLLFIGEVDANTWLTNAQSP